MCALIMNAHSTKEGSHLHSPVDAIVSAYGNIATCHGRDDNIAHRDHAITLSPDTGHRIRPFRGATMRAICIFGLLYMYVQYIATLASLQPADEVTAPMEISTSLATRLTLHDHRLLHV